MAAEHPQAFSVAPSGNWDGNDGAWSTFTVRIGNPAQFFRVLPSTTGQATRIPIPDNCERGQSWCGNARGVQPYNGAGSSPFSGSPNQLLTTSLDAGGSCTANRSPMCITCPGSVDGKCTVGPCVGRNCCGDPAGQCTGVGCNGLNGICTGAYIGCPCTGPDWNAGSEVVSKAGVLDPAAASGFQPNQSSTWESLGDYQLMMNGNLSAQGSDPFLNTSGLGFFGTDAVGLGVDLATGLTLNSSLVVGALTEPYYIGALGLAPTEHVDIYNASASLLMLLKREKMIPSLSYGYTAGAHYRQPYVLGSLTLGGYDSLRSTSGNPSSDSIEISSFELDSSKPESLTVGIQSITVSNALNDNVTVLSEPISALIDTSLPYLSLPLTACKAFETAFGLYWNATKEMYLVNDISHQNLLKDNPTVTFTLAKNSSTPSNNITLPYAAFDLQASNPIFPLGTNYFPLRRATDPSQYTLGRAFLQEAYLFVDYESSNFSLSQAQFSNTTPNIITVDHQKPPSTIAPSTSPSTTPTPKTQTIIGATIGASAFLILLTLLLPYLRRRHHRKTAPLPPSKDSHGSFSAASATSPTGTSEIDGSVSKFVNELEVTSPTVAGELGDPRSPTAQMMMVTRTPSGRERPRQELAGPVAASEKEGEGGV